MFVYFDPICIQVQSAWEVFSEIDRKTSLKWKINNLRCEGVRQEFVLIELSRGSLQADIFTEKYIL